MREILTIEVGQSNIQLGNAIWEQYCADHVIDNAYKRKENAGKDDSFKVFFEETGIGQFVPRNLAVDLEANVIDDIKNGPFVAISHPESLVHAKEDVANNFVSGHLTIGKQIIYKVNDRLRKLVDNCDNVICFFIGHSAGGGTVSGLGALILERLAVGHRKKPKIGFFEIYSSPNLSACVVEPYNALLATHWLLDHTKKQLQITKPNVDNLNKLISKVISAMTASLRFSGEMNVELNEFQKNLVPFHSLHFMTTGMSPIIPKTDVSTAPNDVQKITNDCFKQANWF
ncbi:tubulin alpha 2, partial [Reticulomyxa filosa]